MSETSPPIEISCQDVRARQSSDGPLQLVDCREPDEHALVHLDGALHVPMSQLMARAGELATYKDRPLVVFCHHGQRSLQVAEWLRHRGFTQVQTMAGGIDRWAVEIDPAMPRY
ncbi:MAG: rhodanese-like domain-containing protein [Pirellulales bacterium]